MNLTPHFTLTELCCTTHKELAKTNLEEAKKIMGRMYQLAGFAERVRSIIGKPLIINSGFRCVKLNNSVGGSLTSQHLYAEAIDIKVAGKSSKEVFQILASSDLKYDQLILEKSGNAQWVHVSIGSKKERLIYENGKYVRL
ncbi:MAG: hypothetical protein J6S67_25165 [Methanobrevibacter sp.]|nr:hypothetical protein [Methanobrevibacter sp.]